MPIADVEERRPKAVEASLVKVAAAPSMHAAVAVPAVVADAVELASQQQQQHQHQHQQHKQSVSERKREIQRVWRPDSDTATAAGGGRRHKKKN